MILVIDSRRPTCLDLGVKVQLEAYLENFQNLAEKCRVLGRSGALDIPTGLIVPSSSQGKMVQVACRGRPVTSADVARVRLVDIQDNVYGDSFGWKFLVEATLTAIRIGEVSMKVMVITTDLMLASENLRGDSGCFFSVISQTLGIQAPAAVRISLVFVEVAGSCTSGGTLTSPDLFGAWAKLQQLRDSAHNETYALDLIGNTPAMFDSQLRSWLRESSPRQTFTLRLPATETFSGVVVEVEITPYLLDQRGLMHGDPFPALHQSFTSVEVLQGVELGSLDQGLCRGDPLLCVPSRLHGSPQQYEANRKLFIAVCAELNENDMSLLLAIRRPSTSIQEKWMILPQVPVASSKDLDLPHESPSHYLQPESPLVERALLIRLATKEDIIDEGPVASLGGTEDVECSVERAAACASLGMLKRGMYNPLSHSSEAFEVLASVHGVRSHGNAAFASSRGAGRHPLRVSDEQVTVCQHKMGALPGTRSGKYQRPFEKREISLRYSGPSARRHMPEGKSRRSVQAGRVRVISNKNQRSNSPFGEVKTEENTIRRDSDESVRGHDENMML